MTRSCRYSIGKLLGSGTALASLGCVHALGSLQSRNTFGIAVGVAGLVAGAALLLAAALLCLQGRNPATYSPAQAAVLLPRWGARSITVMGGWLLLLVLVRIASPDGQLNGFPDACPYSKQRGCSRVAEDNSHRDGGVSPVQMPTTIPAATGAVLAWIKQQPRTTILAVQHTPPSADRTAATGVSEAARETVIHARFVSLLWGFADDVFVRLSCNAATGEVLLEAQGQLCVGVGDMDVNVKRNAALMAAMEAEVKRGQLPAGPCTAGRAAAAAGA